MKTRIIAAIIAAFFLLSFFSMAAHATIVYAPDIVYPDEFTFSEDEAPDEEHLPEADSDNDETAQAIEMDHLDTLPRPFSPSGTGTVIDYATDADGKVFYTITAPDDHVFYLVIDRQRNMDNVYFLNAVTVADLLSLAEMPEPAQSEPVTITPSPATVAPEQPETMPPVYEQPVKNNMGMYIFIGAFAMLGGGAGWFFKIYRPRKQGMASGEEYEPPVADDENDYGDWSDDQDDDSDGPPWGNDESGDDE